MFNTEETLELPEDLFNKAKLLFAEEENPKKKKKNFTFYFACLLLLIIISPLIIFIFNFLNSFINFQQTKKALEEKNYQSLLNNSNDLSQNLSLDLKFLEIINPFFKLIGQEETGNKTTTFISFGKSLSLTLQQISSVSLKSGNLFSKVLSGKEGASSEEIINLSKEIETAFSETSKAQSYLKEFSGKELIIGSYVAQVKDLLPEVRDTLLIAKDFLNLSPEFFGQTERKTYLILFQNNSEIRGTGGFIGSYGLVTFDKGKFVDVEIRDVYFADGQLKGFVEPPLPLKTYLGQDVWYLRDSNWDPDFMTSGQRAQWFFDKETGRKVNGVIAINLTVAQRLIEAFGTIEIPDYKEKIDKDNFFEKAEYYSEKGFFPGSTGKEDFLGQVGRVLIEKIKTANEIEKVALVKAVMTSLEEKDLMAYFDAKGLQVFLGKLNWDGSLKRMRCSEGKKCLEDYLMVIETNVAVNKSNYFLKRSIDHQVVISSSREIAETMQINYENQSPSDNFPAGKYRSYLRVYVPLGSRLNSCRINNAICKPDQTTEHNRTVFGFLVEVPVKEKRQVTLSYTLDKPLEGEYLFYTQKQSGIGKDNFTLSLNYPPNMTLENLLPPKKSRFLPFSQSFLTGKGLIVYNTTLLADFFIKANFLIK